MDQFNSEEEQIEAIKKFWKENGIPIIFGAVLGLGGLWGWRFYSEQQLISQEKASDAYNTAMEQLARNDGDVTPVTSFIEANQDSAYSVMAALQLAKEAVERKDLAEAEKQLIWASDNVDDASLKDLSLVRLARVQSELNKLEEAKTTLDKVVSESFKAQVYSVKGDVLVKQEQYAAAQESYTKALELTEGNQSLLQMKIDHLNSKVSS